MRIRDRGWRGRWPADMPRLALRPNAPPTLPGGSSLIQAPPLHRSELNRISPPLRAQAASRLAASCTILSSLAVAPSYPLPTRCGIPATVTGVPGLRVILDIARSFCGFAFREDAWTRPLRSRSCCFGVPVGSQDRAPQQVENPLLGLRRVGVVERSRHERQQPPEGHAHAVDLAADAGHVVVLPF